MDTFRKKNCKNQIRVFIVEKIIRRESANSKLSGKVMVFLSTDGLIKMSQYLPKPFERSYRNIKIELDLSKYATKLI